MRGVDKLPRRPFTQAEVDLLRQLYPGTPTARLAQQLGRTVASVYNMAQRLGLTKTPEYLASPEACRLRRGDQVGKEFRFQLGQVPANKGLRRPGWAPGRMSGTQFKPGERSGFAEKNWRPIGTILPDPEGYLRIKAREASKGEAHGLGDPGVWPMFHRHVWQQHRGPVPAGHIIAFKDGDRANCAIENLECLSRQQLMARNSVHNLPPELKQVIQLTGALKRQVRKHEKQNDRPAQPSL